MEAALPALGRGTSEPDPPDPPGGPGPGGTDEVPRCEGWDKIESGSWYGVNGGDVVCGKKGKTMLFVCL